MAEFSSITTISRELQALTLAGITRVDNQPLGTGSYGQVFAVKHGRETYAAKQIHSILVEAVSPEEKRVVRESFLKECHHCKNLNHPNIVRFIGVYYPDPHSILPVMVMELMDTSLTDYVKKPNISMELKVSILHDVAQGLKFLHYRVSPIIHRDLSPNNILLSRDLVAKISDLGVVKVVKTSGTKSKQSKLTKAPGTADFMPPEALSDNPTYSTGLDIFSYGGVILHVVNQEWPTPTSATVFDPKLRQVKGFTEVERRQKYLDMMVVEAKALKSLVIRCLDNDPTKRPAAANILEELKELKVPMAEHLPYGLLLEDMDGYKKQQTYRIGHPSVSFLKQKVQKGTLLVALSHEESKNIASHLHLVHNYKAVSDLSVSLCCEANQVFQINREQRDKILAVRKLEDRLKAVHKLDWIDRLHFGSYIYVTIPASSVPVRGVIRYIGILNGEIGIMFGVELMERRGEGTDTGTYGGEDLFECDPNCAVYVSMDKISQYLPVDTTVSKPPSPPLMFKLADQVVVVDKHGTKFKGKVRWIGKHEKIDVLGIKADRVIHDLQHRFPYHITTLNHLIKDSKGHSRLFLPAYMVKQIEDQSSNGGTVSHGHNYDTRFPQQKHSYYPHDPHDEKHQKQALKKFEQRKEEARKEKETIESNERRYLLQQIKKELQIGDIKDFDDTMLDRKRQEKIMEDLKRQKKENKQNSSQIDKTNATYNEPAPTVPQSRSTLSDYRYDQQLHNNHQIAQQDPPVQGMHPQDVHSQGMFHPDVGQHGMYPQGTPQQSMYLPPQERPPHMSPQGMPNQGVPYHGMPQQHMQSQGMYQQGMPQPGMHPQAVYPQDQYPQGTNMAQGLPYQQGMPQNYQTQQYNQPSNNGNWRGENHRALYPVERQRSIEFNQILRAGTNAPNDTNSSGMSQTVSTKQYQNTQDMYRPPEPHRQMEALDNMLPLEVGDAIQSGNNPVSYGTVKWIGELQGCKGLIAGIEMEQPVLGPTDGWHDGYQYFMCEPGKGVFLRLDALRRDDRFTDVKGQTTGPGVPNPLGKFDLNSCIKSKTFIQPSETVVERVHTGGGKGIQGHQNSCYLDSTLYGLFAFSGAFDDLFLKEATDQIGMTIKSTLQSIVNTLRHNNVVFYDHIMILRDELDKLQHIKGLKSDEKDPENFLNLLFKHVLNVEAFFRIKRPFGIDKEFFVQLFVEGNKHHFSNTQDLLTKMCNEQQITFAKYPLRLLLQIPRYGKKFRTFKGVIPSLELDVTTLCEQYAGKCMVCSKPGSEFCPDCGPGNQIEGASYFCRECVGLWHSHEKRRHHKPVSRQSSSDGGDPGRLRLLSVLCIETSHYVCFTRVQGSGTNEWVFFDSMAERPDDVHNIPRVTQCTQELNEWVYGTKELTNYTSKELPQLVRRFVEDGYLCIYVDQDGIMYGDDGGAP